MRCIFQRSSSRLRDRPIIYTYDTACCGYDAFSRSFWVPASFGHDNNYIVSKYGSGVAKKVWRITSSPSSARCHLSTGRFYRDFFLLSPLCENSGRCDGEQRTGLYPPDSVVLAVVFAYTLLVYRFIFYVM